MKMETEIDRSSKTGVDETNEVIQKYENVVESLQQDLKECQDEQIRIRAEMNNIARENKDATNIVREAFYQANSDDYHEIVKNHECIENLQKQIAILQLEKDSMFQLWQMSLKTVDSLEQELKKSYNDEKITKHYEDQINNVKETYSEVIKILESKLLQAKENFTKQQVMWQSTKEMMNKLKNDKIELEEKLMSMKNDTVFNHEINCKTIEKLESDLNVAKHELEILNKSKIELENELTEARCFTMRVVAKDRESKEKVAEAIELVETAVREKELVLQRETMIMDEKKKLETRLAKLSDEFMTRLDKELNELKEDYTKINEKYISEIKDLKVELREKTVELDEAHRKNHFVEEELEKMRHCSENYLERSSTRVFEFEQKFKDSQHKLEACEESLRRKYDNKIREYENQIRELEEKLANVNYLRRNYVHNANDMDERMIEAVEKYSNIERRLIRTLDERNNITSELQSLQLTHDREINRRENERLLLENRIKELQIDIQKANNLADKSVVKADTFGIRIESLEKELEQKNKNEITVECDNVKCSHVEKSMELRIIKEKFEEKISELTKYVKIHQKLSARWKEEAQLLASKFHDRYKKLRSQINVLKKENEVLNKELISWREQVTLCRTQTIQRYDQGDNGR